VTRLRGRQGLLTLRLFPVFLRSAVVCALNILRRTDADLICLEEVTPRFLEALMAAPWVRRGYYLTEADPRGPRSSVMPYGQVILSKMPFHSSVVGRKESERRVLKERKGVRGKDLHTHVTLG